MSEPQSAGNESLVSRTEFYSALAKGLRLFVGRRARRRYSYKDVEIGTGIPARLLEAATHEPGHEDWRALPIERIMALSLFLGADFTSQWLKVADQGAFDLPDDEPNPGDIATDTSDAAASVVRGFQGGSIHQLPNVGQVLMKRGAQLVAMAGRAA